MNTTNVLVPLPKLRLPKDYARANGLITAIEAHYGKKDKRFHYNPPRFVGYYFAHKQSIALCRNLRVTLPADSPVKALEKLVKASTCDLFEIAAPTGEVTPLYLLVHDQWDATCYLWSFDAAHRFLSSAQAVLEEENTVAYYDI